MLNRSFDDGVPNNILYLIYDEVQIKLILSQIAYPSHLGFGFAVRLEMSIFLEKDEVCNSLKSWEKKSDLKVTFIPSPVVDLKTMQSKYSENSTSH